MRDFDPIALAALSKAGQGGGGGGGGSELPEVAAADNGKFLGVVNGAWAKADVPSDYTITETNTYVVQPAASTNNEFPGSWSSHPDSAILVVGTEEYEIFPTDEERFDYKTADMEVIVTDMGSSTTVSMVDDIPDGTTCAIYTIAGNVTVNDRFKAAVAKAAEPLIVTLTPTYPMNPLAGGTHNASEADLSAAWASGRKIRAVISGVADFDLSLFDAGANMYTCNFVYAASGSVYMLVLAHIRAAAGTYGCNIFALTPAT